jgi:hypothetical protein
MHFTYTQLKKRGTEKKLSVPITSELKEEIKKLYLE